MCICGEAVCVCMYVFILMYLIVHNIGIAIKSV